MRPQEFITSTGGSAGDWRWCVLGALQGQVHDFIGILHRVFVFL